MKEMIYTHKEITQRDLNAIVLANKKLIAEHTHTMGLINLGTLNQMIFKFLNQEQIDYVVSNLEN